MLNTAHKELEKVKDINHKNKSTLLIWDKKNCNNTVIFSIYYEIFTDYKLNHVH